MKKNALAVLASLLLGGLAALAPAADLRLAIDGSTTVGPIAKAFAEYLTRQDARFNITVSESGSGNGAKSLLNGTCDIATLSRDLKSGEKAAMDEKGVKPVVHVCGHDALTVVVHPSNKITGLTVEQLRDVYTGKITNWKELGGFDRKIVILSRDSNSGTFECFGELVLGKGVKVSSNAETAGSNGAVLQRIQSTPGAIGYIGLGYVTDAVKTLAVNGVESSPETVLDGTYPIARKLFMVTNGEPEKGSAAATFLGLIHSKEGREMTEEVGFVPVFDGE